MLGLLYFGRLEKEKGFDAIIEMITRFSASGGELPFQLFVFGTGTYAQEIMQLAHRHKTIHYFGRQSLATIKRYVSNCDYILMPSTCIETFGLIALTGAQWGIPTIAYAKGGTQAFISDHLDLNQIQGKTNADKLYHLVSQLSEHKSQTPLTHSLDLSAYSLTEWKSKVAYLLGDKKKILLVSDFTTRIGGIETYVDDIAQIMREMGYQVQVLGAKIPRGKLGNMIKLLGFFAAIANIRAAIQLAWKIKTFQPDLIRYHSIMRYIGRLPLRVSKWSHAEQWMMYHDLGYFYPFPSKLTELQQIKYPLTLANFIRSAKSNNPLTWLAMTGKGILLLLIRHQLQKRISKHLIPSAFIGEIIHKSYHIPNENIEVLSHFIQE